MVWERVVKKASKTWYFCASFTLASILAPAAAGGGNSIREVHRILHNMGRQMRKINPRISVQKHMRWECRWRDRGDWTKIHLDEFWHWTWNWEGLIRSSFHFPILRLLKWKISKHQICFRTCLRWLQGLRMATDAHRCPSPLNSENMNTERENMEKVRKSVIQT